MALIKRIKLTKVTALAGVMAGMFLCVTACTGSGEIIGNDISLTESENVTPVTVFELAEDDHSVPTVTPVPIVTPEPKEEPVGVTVTEWMPKNRSTWIAESENGTMLQPDYIELHNIGTVPADLSALYLSNDRAEPFMAQLPGILLEPDAYCLIFCTGQGERVAGGISVPFKLNKDGGTLILTGCRGTVFCDIQYGESEQDHSFVYENGLLKNTAYPTPGAPNTAEAYETFAYGGEAADGLCIYEAMTANRTESRTAHRYYDWVEIKNCSSEQVCLAGYSLTDKLTEPERGTLPDVTLAPGSIMLFYCSGDASLSVNGTYHLGFRLNGGEESLFLVDALGRTADVMRLFDTPYDGSLGRMDGENGVYCFEKPTPGKDNANGTKRTVRTDMPVPDTVSGQFDGPVTVSLEGKGTVYYTTDGSIPTQKSKKYEAPLTFQKTTVLRAVALEEGKRVSQPMTVSLLIKEDQTLPVVSVALDPADYKGDAGIFTNPLEEWEKLAHVTFLIDGDTVERDCGIRISGQASRERLHKSFRLVFRGRYGGQLKYDLFKDGVSVSTFTELLLRGGTDSKYGVIREPFMASVALNDKATTMIQSMRPAVMYVNGEYYGIQMIAEAYCDDFFGDYFGTDPDTVEMVKGTLKEKNGGEELYPLLQYMRKNDLSKQEHYEYVASRLDIDSVIDWAIFEAYYGNDDISGNIRYVRYEGTGGKWRFVLYDVEFGMKSPASFELPLHEGQTGDMVSALMKNASFKDAFLKRLAYHCNVTFARERCLAIYTFLDEAVRPEIERDFKHWKCDPAVYLSNYKQISRLIGEKDRPGQLKSSIKKEIKLTDRQMQEYFGE